MGRGCPTLWEYFFVWKSDKERLRMILDTRKVNGRFEDPHYTQLATASAWGGLRTAPGAPLCLAQADVDNAFYRVRLAEGMAEHFILPAVHGDTLRRLGAACGFGM